MTIFAPVMNRRILYYVAALLWGVPGIMITVKGIRAYTQMAPENLWWLLLITAFVLTGFYFMFTKIVNKYCARLAALPQKASLLQTFPVRGWVLIVFMSCLGMALKFLGVPAAFTASFYSGLGPMLVLAAVRFCIKAA